MIVVGSCSYWLSSTPVGDYFYDRRRLVQLKRHDGNLVYEQEVRDLNEENQLRLKIFLDPEPYIMESLL